MPAPRTDIDREAVAASIALHGIRGAARITGLPVATVQDIAKAGNVVVPGSPVRTIIERVTSVRSVQDGSVRGSVRPAHAMISDELARNGATARLAMSQIAARTLPHVAEMACAEPESALARAGDIKSIVGAAQGANVPGFERQREERAGVSLTLNMLHADDVLDLPSCAMQTIADSDSGESGLV